jgi:hypothetical protein
MEDRKKIPWIDHAFSMATSYSILTAMVGVLLAVIITDKEINDYWYWPISLLGISFVCFVWGVEKLSDALDENDVDKYLAWFLAYNSGVIMMFFGIATYIFIHYHLQVCTGGLILFLISCLASKKWISDNWSLIFSNKQDYDDYRKELLGVKIPEKDPDWLMNIYHFIRRIFHE